MTRRELALLLPLLALYVAAWAFFPERPDDEASYVVLAERLVGRLLRHGRRRRASWTRIRQARISGSGPGLPALLAPLVAVDAPLSVLRLTSAVRAVRRGAAHVRPRARALGAACRARRRRMRSGSTSRSSACCRTCTARCSPCCSSSSACSGSPASSSDGGLGWLVLGAAGLAGLALTRVAYGWVLTVALVVAPRVVARAAVALGRASGRRRRARPRALRPVARVHLCEDRPPVRLGELGQPLALLDGVAATRATSATGTRRTSSSPTPTLRPHRAFFESLRGLDARRAERRDRARGAAGTSSTIRTRTPRTSSRTSRGCSSTRPYSRTLQQTNDVFYALPNAILLGATRALRLRARSRGGGRCRRRPASSRCSARLPSRCTRSSPRTRGCSRRSSRSSCG